MTSRASAVVSPSGGRSGSPTGSTASSSSPSSLTSTSSGASSASASEASVNKDIWAMLVEERARTLAQMSSTAAAAAAGGSSSSGGAENEDANASDASAAQANSATAATTPSREATLLFIGPRQSGKTSLVQAYMYKDRDEVPKPTSSLDYKYTRTSAKDKVNEEKSLSHFWEIGGGRSMTNLMDICLPVDSLRDALCCIVLDCSRLSALVDDALFFIEAVRKHVAQLCSSSSSQLYTQLTRLARKRFGESHPDHGRLSILPVTTILFLHKYDVIYNQQPEDLRIVARTMRAIAHQNGCSLMYTTVKHKEGTMKTFRNRISHHLVGSEKKPSGLQLDHVQYVNVPAGLDSFAQIGEALNGGNRADDWIAAFRSTFPTSAQDAEPGATLETLQLRAEPMIDQIIAHKDDELKRLKRELDLKRRLKETDMER